MAQASVPARCSRILRRAVPIFAPVWGVSASERRLSEGAPSDSCAARSVCPELRRTVSAIPNRSAPKSTSTCHYNGSIFAVSQASCLPARQHAPHDPCAKPALCRFSPGPFGTCSFMDLMGNPPQGGGIPLLDIGEQLTTKAVNAARRRRMLAGRVDFHRFSTPSLASTCSLCSIIHSSACCVLKV